MWLIVPRQDRISLEFWAWREPGRYELRPSVTLTADLSFEQWSLIKRQFDNMGIVPRGEMDGDR